MKNAITLKRFQNNRRSAVGIIFAICLLPLVLLVGLAIDFSFFTEARSQIQIAADAAATHAIRAATGTYALETSQGTDVTTAKGDATTAGNQAGLAWFTAQLGQLPTAYVPSNTSNLSVDTEVATSGAGFTTTVKYTGIYPPFFDRLFNTAANWYITGNSQASAQYNYVEIVMMLDTSQSMLIGADAPDILKMNENTVCMSPQQVSMNALSGDNPMYIPGLYGTTSTPQYGAAFNSGGLVYQYGANDGNKVDFSGTNIQHYIHSTYNANSNPNGGPNNPNDTAGSCAAGYQEPYFSTAQSPGNTGGAGVPCAFACHYSTGTYGGYSTDLYGLARSLNVKLRLDSVLQATEQVITSMIDSESASNQFAVGVYQFNANLANQVTTLATGTGGGSGAGYPNYEATYNLSTVLSAVQNNDYSYKAESTFPPVDTVDDGNTDFPTSMANFISGKATSNNAIGAVAANPGKSATNPLKDIFIVTDGMNDSCCGGAGRRMGQMTGILAEQGKGINKAVCQPLKTLGFTVYVLYITYTPIPHLTYYLPYKTAGYSSPSNSYLNEDFPSLSNGAEADYNGSTTANASAGANPPDVQALQACASTTSGNLDFYTATSSADIAKAMSSMLQAALGSAIQVTN